MRINIRLKNNKKEMKFDAEKEIKMGRTYRMTFTEKELNDLSTILEEYDKELFKQWVRAKNTTYEMYNQDYSLSEFDKAHDVVDYAFRQYIDIQNLYFRILKKYQKIMMSNNSK